MVDSRFIDDGLEFVTIEPPEDEDKPEDAPRPPEPEPSSTPAE